MTVNSERPRPKCIKCNNVAKRQGKTKYGFYKHAKLCSWHHKKLYKQKSSIGYQAHKLQTCAYCGFIPKHKCQLDVDHIDGNHSNNLKSNLQTLCANCHRLKTFENKEGIYKTTAPK